MKKLTKFKALNIYDEEEYNEYGEPETLLALVLDKKPKVGQHVMFESGIGVVWSGEILSFSPCVGDGYLYFVSNDYSYYRASVKYTNGLTHGLVVAVRR